MAEKSSFFTSLNGDRKYKAEEFATYFGTFIGNGVFPNPSTNLIVTSNGDMTINIAKGFAWINGYMYNNTDNLTLTVDHADAALKRIDRVVVKCDFISREIKAYVKKGVFASNPVPPSLERGVNAYEISIADIMIDNGIIAINQSNITDTRLDNLVCGIVTQTVQEIDTSELYRKLQGFIDERGQDVDYWLNQSTATWEIEFNTWFDTIKGILDGDIAGALANRILVLENTVNNLELVSTSVTRPSGKTVEESLAANETSILEVKQSVSNGKSKIATAITGKGVSTGSDASFGTMASNIDKIKLGQGNAVESDVLNGKTFTNSDGILRTGNISTIISNNITGGRNSSGGIDMYPPKGYYNGNSKLNMTESHLVYLGYTYAGKKYASGSGVQYSYDENTVVIRGLSFRPRKITIASNELNNGTAYYSMIYDAKLGASYIVSIAASSFAWRTDFAIYDDGFQLPFRCSSGGAKYYTWEAYE